MNERPAPLTPADCDLQDFAFMPLDVQRLRDSELASNESPEACWAAVLLWSASWHQIPAASIPSDEMWIAKQAGYQLRGKIDKAWASIRPGALRGWIECSDGRLYHPVVAEKARDSWKMKNERKERDDHERDRKRRERDERSKLFEQLRAAGTTAAWNIGTTELRKLVTDLSAGQVEPVRVTGQDESRLRQGQGQGQGQGHPSSVPYGTGGAAAGKRERTPEESRKSELWRAIKALLVDSGESKDLKAAGAVVTKAITRFDEPTALAAIEATLHARPAGVIAYLEAACQQATGQRPNKQESLEAGNLAAAERFAMEE